MNTITYSDTASVIQSVAFTYGANIGGLYTSDVCVTVDAHIHHPSNVMVTSHATYEATN